MNKMMQIGATLMVALHLPVIAQTQEARSVERPNILWLVGEDAHASWFGCYGNESATTPNIDRLAAEGFRYTHAYASAPVCAPSRSTWITGINAISMGTHPMRSRYEIPHDLIKYYPDYLKKGGYFTINQTKTDYNIGGRPDTQCWDAKGVKSDGWKLAKSGQPWFEVVNCNASHESRAQGDVTQTRHSPKEMTLAKYHPDVLEIRQNYALYSDAVENLDTIMGKKLAELKASGQEENTIVIFCTDHGGVLPRSKRFLFDSGTHAPLIIRIPEKYKQLWPAEAPGSTVDRLVSFLDFPKTWLSITGSPVPSNMQGRIFMGPQAEPEPQYVFSFRGRMDEGYDNQRAVRDKRYVYIKNYMPFVAWGQHLDYLWKMAATQAWDKAHKEGATDAITDRFFNTKPQEELYDCEADPDNVVNLADNPEYREMMVKMRGKLQEWQMSVHDAGLLPEAETQRRAEKNNTTIYEMVRNPKRYNLPAYLAAADLAISADPTHKGQFVADLKNSDSGLRYWGIVGLLMLNKDALVADDLTAVRSLLNDPCGEVRALASWILIRSGDQKSGQDCLNKMISTQSPTRLFAMNILRWMPIERIDPYADSLLNMVILTGKKQPETIKSGDYEARLREYLLESNGVKIPVKKGK